MHKVLIGWLKPTLALFLSNGREMAILDYQKLCIRHFITTLAIITDSFLLVAAYNPLGMQIQYFIWRNLRFGKSLHFPQRMFSAGRA